MIRTLSRILLLIIIPFYSFGQSLSVFDVNIKDYPVVKAKFFALDANDSMITNLSEPDFVVTEDGEVRDVVLVTCPPPEPPKALSAILTIDVSGSMAGLRSGYAKAAAIEWVNALPLGKSECAISSFNSANFFVQDFTTDRQKLIDKINLLGAAGGTNYEAGFIDEKAGGLLVAEPGKYKKVLVFLSDGNPNFPPDEAAIIQKAKEDSVTIYCVTLDMKCPECLKNISQATGGSWYENITSKEQAEEVYRNILLQAQGGDPCEIHWLSEGCPLNRTANIQIPAYSLSTDVKYTTPVSELPHLEITPGLSFRFGVIEPATTAEQDITITARVGDVQVDDITKDNQYYTIKDYGGSPPPFTLAKDAGRTLTIEFAPQDSAYQLCKFDIVSNACGGNKFYASGGDIFKRVADQTIHLIHPNGGERFLVGSDTVITWEDVMPSDTVLLDYSTDGGNSWIFITDTAYGLSYDWHVPDTPSDSCLARVSVGYIYDMYLDMAFIPPGQFKMGNITYSEGYSREFPVHEVTITNPFFLGRYEVTQALWNNVMDSNPSRFKGDSLPVEEITWYEAIEFCNKLSDLRGLERCYSGTGDDIICNWNAKGYRLPTEAEWEYACRAGTETDYYSGNMTAPNCSPIDVNLNKVGWYCSNSGNTTHIVGLKEPNLFGLYDMHGNVREWCWDWYRSDYYYSSPSIDPKGPSTAIKRISRGDAWNDLAKNWRSCSRNGITPNSRFYINGFRIARSY